MYDHFSSDYDRFVNWQSRLAVELPFIEQLLSSLAHIENPKPRVLDTACGTGMHAIALAEYGYPTVGVDLSGRMVEKARANAVISGVDVPFIKAGFGELAQVLGGANLLDPPYEALLCLGNSLPHLLTSADLAAALTDFAACLCSGGLLLIQNRNFDAVLTRHERWMEPQAHLEGDSERLFLRFYDFESNGLINFNIVTLSRQGENPWTQQIMVTPLYPLRQEELTAALDKAGFAEITHYGSMAGDPFDLGKSGNLVVTAILKK
jgi:SAM-dependent methyltransferase